MIHSRLLGAPHNSISESHCGTNRGERKQEGIIATAVTVHVCPTFTYIHDVSADQPALRKLQRYASREVFPGEGCRLRSVSGRTADFVDITWVCRRKCPKERVWVELRAEPCRVHDAHAGSSGV